MDCIYFTFPRSHFVGIHWYVVVVIFMFIYMYLPIIRASSMCTVERSKSLLKEIDTVIEKI